MASWPAAASGPTFYYSDLAAAEAFYLNELGLTVVSRSAHRVVLRLASTSYITLAGSKDLATAPKATAIAVLTNTLDEWDERITARGLPRMQGKGGGLSFLTRNPGSAHDGFVILDPEGYKIEFEQFNPHPENEHLIPLLYALPDIPTTLPGLSFHAHVSWLYYRDPPAARSWHTGALGLQLVLEQPTVADVYQTSASGFFGAVNEANGMSDWAPSPAITLSFLCAEPELATTGLEGWIAPEGQDNDNRRISDVDGVVHVLDVEGYSLEFLPLAGSWFGNISPKL